ncbi:MAG TPA: hypothetical protein VK154_04050 [Chitinophagales bacterium]|nr:hypothetical protein [Chitinophagales bacterium]
MAKTEHYYTQFCNDNFYHIYNRTVDRKPLFANDGNYKFFLKQYDNYLSDVIDTYAYCLLGNHFHLLVRVRSEADLTTFAGTDLSTFKKLTNLNTNTADETFKKLSNLNAPKQPKTAHQIVSHQFRKFFQSYAMAFNKQQDRTGTLFQTPFKRALVDSEKYFAQLVYYIHANPQLHGLTGDFKQWAWSSYTSMLADKPTKLKKQEVLEWFGSANSYRQYHAENQKLTGDDKLFLEDEI